MFMNYKVTCNNCKQADYINIDKDAYILWDKTNYIISGRKRLDLQWGWQCRCGNSSLLTKQEMDKITDKVNPDPKEISEIIKNLKVEPNTKFTMARA